MAYFITASTSASVTQTTFDTTGSIVTSSLFTPNDPLNVDNITTIKKSKSQYPSLNRPIYKESVSFTDNNGTAINWLYDNTASRDHDFDLIKILNTNYEKSGGGSWVGTATSDLNMATYDIYGIANVTASGNISASGQLTVGTASIAGITYPITDGTDGQVIITDGFGNLSFATSTTERLHLQIRNDDSVDITAGTPVYSTGAIGGSERLKVRISSASDASTMPAIGIAETTLTTTGDGKDGFAIINGIYNDNITPVGSSPSLGDTIYVHCDGGITINKPSGSNLIQNIGIVLKTNGTIIQQMKVSSIDRTNDVPNLLHNQIFYGSGSNQSYQTHLSGALDTTIINNITASGDISASGTVTALTGSFGTITGLSPITVTDSITFQQPITASIISASTFSGDGSGLTNVPESNDIDVYLNFEEATSFAYIVPYDLQFAGFTTSSTFTAQFSSSGAPYTFGTTLTQFDTLAITSSAAGLITLSGSKL